MNNTLLSIGKQRSWNLIRKLGEGDAGEVFEVESLLDKKQAILKRPRQGSFSTDIIRQAAQIEAEGLALHELGKLRLLPSGKNRDLNFRLVFPGLIDKSQPGTEFSDRYFIVIDKAEGFELSYLTRIVKTGIAESRPLPDGDQRFINRLVHSQIFPRLLSLRVIAALLLTFEAVHKQNIKTNNTEYAGLIWNDIKLDHVYWSPTKQTITLIDWGNSKFLEQDGITKDRVYSKYNDYAQFTETFGAFLIEYDPELAELLDWPHLNRLVTNYSERINRISQMVFGHLSGLEEQLSRARDLETGLISTQSPDKDLLDALNQTQIQILDHGETPDSIGADLLKTNLALKFVREGNLDEFFLQIDSKEYTDSKQSGKWGIVYQISQYAQQMQGEAQQGYLSAIQAGLSEDWSSVLWNLLLITGDAPEPIWWGELSARIRSIGLGIDVDALPPLIIAKRMILSMQSSLKMMQDQSQRTNERGEVKNIDQGSDSSAISHPSGSSTGISLQSLEELIIKIRDEAISNWDNPEPDPPHSRLEYSEIDRILSDLIQSSPEYSAKLVNSLVQPNAQIQHILDSWNKKEFAATRRGLRQLLMWDPDRRRVLIADSAIRKTPKWLERVYQGPGQNQEMVDYLTEIEFTGRELSNYLGAADWLGQILYACAHLRRGRRVGELLVEYPAIIQDMPWLDRLEPRIYVPLSRAQPIELKRQPALLGTEIIISGQQSGRLGQSESIYLTEPLDTWAPEARGSSARAFIGFFHDQLGQLKQAAVKIMRPDQLSYSLPLFREETQILHILRDTPGVAPLVECGFMQLDDGLQLPMDTNNQSARNLSGSLLRFGTDQVSNFLNSLEIYAHKGWAPYLAIPKLDHNDNLMWICDAGYTRGQFLPIEKSLRLALQICDLLKIAHNNNIVYRDHKLLHYYWNEMQNGVFMIDWNVARYHPQGLSKSEIQFDLVQLGARAFHHIFTGRVAPGALADGPNRVEEIEAAANSYAVQWTYDDRRLPPDLKEILEQLLANNYQDVAILREDLYQVYQNLVSTEIFDEDHI